jgi:hypothetical protein
MPHVLIAAVLLLVVLAVAGSRDKEYEGKPVILPFKRPDRKGNSA